MYRAHLGGLPAGHRSTSNWPDLDRRARVVLIPTGLETEITTRNNAVTIH